MYCRLIVLYTYVSTNIKEVVPEFKIRQYCKARDNNVCLIK
jgi:hypothetical protein